MRWSTWIMGLVVIGFAAGCGGGGNGNDIDSGPDTDSDTDSDADTDADSGTDADTDSDTDSDSDTDTDADTDSDTDTDTDADTDADLCSAGGNWYDPTTGLCWQNPPLEDPIWGNDAAAYCDDLSLGGFDDWRLPMIQELISLIRGCVDGTATGDLSTSECPVTDPDCLGNECDDSSCVGCYESGGPDDDPAGCYWVPELEGECWYYWSSSVVDGEEYWVWRVSFDWSMVNNFSTGGTQNLVRCVRGGP